METVVEATGGVSGMAADITAPIDPMAAFSQDDVVVTVDGYGEWDIPYLTAARWIESAITSGGMPVGTVMSTVAVPGPMVSKIGRGEISDQALSHACESVIESVSGRRWWVTMNIISTTVASWDTVGGELVLRGVDANRLSLANWIDAAWMMLRKMSRNSGESEYSSLLLNIGRRPIQPGSDPEEMSEEDFDAVIAAAQF